MRFFAFPVLLVLSAGCASPPLRLVPSDTIRNKAVLEYAYGNTEPFRVESAPVEIVVLAPPSSGGDWAVAAESTAVDGPDQVLKRPGLFGIERNDTAGAPAEDPDWSAQDAQAELADVLLGGADSSQPVGAFGQGSSKSQTQLSDTARLATVSEQASASYGKSLAHVSSSGATEYRGSMHAKALSAHTGQRVAAARIHAAAANADAEWGMSMPGIRLSVAPRRVAAGEKFAYEVEIINDSGLDLEYVAVLDTFNERLHVESSAVRARPRMGLDVDLSGNSLRVHIPDGIKRGQTVTIIIPAELKAEALP